MFITFEGPEGGGKTTQIEAAASWLRSEGREVVTTREPGGLPQAEVIRDLVLHGDLGPESEALLFLAARAEHVRKIIRPALERGAIVLCDRFTDSTIAYQGYGLGLDLETLRGLCRFASLGLAPNLTLLLDLRPDLGLERRLGSARQSARQLTLEMDLGQQAGMPAQAVNKMENRDLAFHRRVRDGFLREAEREPERIVKIDASRSFPVVERAITREIRTGMRLASGESRGRRSR